MFSGTEKWGEVMSYGCFVDIAQQDGSKVRMYYPSTKQNQLITEWIGINEQMAEKYRKDTNQ